VWPAAVCSMTLSLSCIAAWAVFPALVAAWATSPTGT
jgi:hypothetical protein